MATYETSFGDLNNLELTLEDLSQYLDVSGTFVSNGLEIDGYNLMLDRFANPDGVTVETGSFLLAEAGILTVNDVTFSNFIDSIGTLIDQGDPFDPLTETVYWFEVTDRLIQIGWSVAPVPEVSASLLFLVGAIVVSLNRRRSRPCK